MRPTRVSAYVQENGASLCLRFLEAVVSILCSLLLLCGVAAACFAAVFTWDSQQSMLHASHQLQSPNPSELVYLYALGAVGVIASLAAAFGLWAVSRRSLWLLNLHLVTLSLLLAGQLCMVGWALASHTGPGLAVHGQTGIIHASARDIQPFSSSRLGSHQQRQLQHAGGAPGLDQGSSSQLGASVVGEAHRHMWAAVHMNKQLVLTVVASVGLGLQVLTLMCSCALQSTYSQIDEAAQDAAEEATERRPLLPAQAHPSPRRQANRAHMPEDAATVEWRTRMQERYGIDTRQFTYDPSAAGRQDAPPELGPSGSQASSGRCAIM